MIKYSCIAEIFGNKSSNGKADNKETVTKVRHAKILEA